MRIERVGLTNFRNFASAEVELSARRNLVVGPNAQGKTNLLEAIHILCVGRSHRDRKDENLVRFGETFYRIEGTVEHIGVRTTVEVAYGEQRKRIRVNAKETRPANLIGLTPVVASSPEDIDLIKRSPGYRRTFIDMALSQLSRDYLVTLQQYMKALAHRNVLIRRRQEGRATRSESDVWDQAIVDLGERIVTSRIQFLGEMEREVEENFSVIGGEPTRIELIYEPRGYSLDGRAETKGSGQGFAGGGVREGLARALEAMRQLELVRGFTLFGPHVDDFKFLCGGRDIRIFGSEGEQRTAVLALTCAEVSLIRAKAGYYPIVLLDDVFAELDESRSGALTSLISGFDQIILTSSRRTPPAEGEIEEIMVAEGRITYG